MKHIAKTLRLLLLCCVLFAAMAVCAEATELKTGIGIVNASSLRLRAKPNTSAEILGCASKNDAVVIIRDTGTGWYLVDYNLEIGYMSSDYLTVKTAENVALGDGQANESVVNIRTAPDANASLATQMSYGEKAEIIGLNNTYYKVIYNGITGYIRSDLLVLTEKPLENTDGVTGGTQSIGEQLAQYACGFIGTPYVWGGSSTSGFDCSGFTQYVYKAYGVSINRTAASQMSNGYSVSNLQAGDLVFFGNTYSSSEAATHVGIYIGNGQFVHSAGSGVKITSMSDSYYSVRYVGARRIF